MSTNPKSERMTDRQIKNALRRMTGELDAAIARNAKKEAEVLARIAKWTSKSKLATTKLRKYRRRLSAIRAARRKMMD